MSAITYEDKASGGLEQLGLTIAREHLDTASLLAAAERWSYSHFLGYLLEGRARFSPRQDCAPLPAVRKSSVS